MQQPEAETGFAEHCNLDSYHFRVASMHVEAAREHIRCGEFAAAVHACCAAIRLVPNPGSDCHLAALWQRAVAAGRLGQAELALSQTVASIKAGALTAGSAAIKKGWLPQPDAITSERKRLAAIVCDIDDDDDDDQSVYVHKSKLWYRCARGSAWSGCPNRSRICRYTVEYFVLVAFLCIRQADGQQHSIRAKKCARSRSWIAWCADPSADAAAK